MEQWWRRTNGGWCMHSVHLLPLLKPHIHTVHVLHFVRLAYSIFCSSINGIHSYSVSQHSIIGNMMWFSIANKLIFLIGFVFHVWMCESDNVCFSFYFFYFFLLLLLSVYELLIILRHPFATETIQPHRHRFVSMVAVIIVFINRRHSIHKADE